MRTIGLMGSVHLPGRVISVPVARAFVRELLGVAGWAEADDVLLLVSELVTNAVRYSDSGRRPNGLVALTVTDNGRSLRVDVLDEGSRDGAPCVREAGSESDNGRGLWLVEHIASTWGVREDETGRTVWFEMNAPR